MTANPQLAPFNRPAFTLLEILLVIAIVVVLASITIGGLGYYEQKVKYSRTEVLLASVGRALEDYSKDYGYYPQGNGGPNSTAQVYVALFGDGKLIRDSDTGEVTIDPLKLPDGDNTDTDGSDGTVYLETLNPDFTGKKSNVQVFEGNYLIVDSWANEEANTARNRIRYRHNPTDPLVVTDMMNPVNDYDLWSKGPNGTGAPDQNTAADIADDIKNW